MDSVPHASSVVVATTNWFRSRGLFDCTPRVLLWAHSTAQLCRVQQQGVGRVEWSGAMLEARVDHCYAIQESLRLRVDMEISKVMLQAYPESMEIMGKTLQCD